EGSGWTTYLWDREQVLMELNKNGTTTVRYTQAPRGYGDVVSQRRSSASTFWHFDAIGSMRFLTAADQSKAINYVYDAFGITRSVSGTTTNRFRYIGKLGYYLEPALGCYYLRRRYYVHWLGRFLSKDPVRNGGENVYAYVNNRPTRGTDASGLEKRKKRCRPTRRQRAKCRWRQIRRCQPFKGVPGEEIEFFCEDPEDELWEGMGGDPAGQWGWEVSVSPDPWDDLIEQPGIPLIPIEPPTPFTRPHDDPCVWPGWEVCYELSLPLCQRSCNSQALWGYVAQSFCVAACLVAVCTGRYMIDPRPHY
ncbi:MAG: RHS repeat-associated core domain-containing protein, partial [Armatimonadetes bacterium]|nr:RHS repeat-associated core domain-containing protein [Armatimonadota bacterium]